MRVGQNPAKFIDHVPQPARVTVVVVTYIPFLSGYYAESLEVLKACLASLWENTGGPYDLLVFDNASCAEVRAFLSEAHSQGRIQYLVLSDQNVGKGGAWNLAFLGAPGEIIAYADSDIYFRPGWLEHTLELLEAFPRVGMVTARPLRTPETYFTSTLEWSAGAADLEKGQFMSWEAFSEHSFSVGASEDETHQWFQTSYDYRLHYQGLSAYAGAAHFQFTAPKEVLKTIFPIPMDRPMGQVRALDQKMNEAGYLRLNTCEAYVKHMGNRVEGTAAQAAAPAKRSLGAARGLLNRPFIRRRLLKVYEWIFRLYFEAK